jgi:glycosyltransferase involved in cell wall biosynthesis
VVDKLYVAHAGDISIPSGGTQRISGILTKILDSDIDVCIIAPCSEEPYGRLGEADLIRINVSDQSYANQPIRSIKIAKKIRQISLGEDDILQIEHSLLAGVVNIFTSKPYVVDIHDISHSSPIYSLPIGTTPLRLLLKYLEINGINKANGSITVSNYMNKYIETGLNARLTNNIVLPNAFDESVVKKYRQKDHIEGKVVFFGTLHEKVNFEIISEIHKLESVNKICVVGGGPRIDELMELKDENSLDNMEILGRCPNEVAYPILSDAHLAINPQDSSPTQKLSSPVKLYDYSALGLPSVVQEGPEIVADLVDIGACNAASTESEFVEYVENILSNPDLREQMSEMAIQYSLGNSWKSRSKSLLDFYHRI